MKERLCRIIQNWDVITKTCQQITFEKRGWNIPFKEKNPCKDLDEGNGVFSSRNKDAFDFSKQLWPVLAPNHHTNESCVHKKNHQFSWLLNRAPYNDLIPHITGYFFSPVYPFFIAHIITARNCPMKPKCVETTKRCFFLGVVAFCTMPSPMGRGRSTKGETLGDTYFGRKMAKVAHFFRQTRRKKKQVIELNHKHISRLHWLIESTSTLLARKPENPPKKNISLNSWRLARIYGSIPNPTVPATSWHANLGPSPEAKEGITTSLHKPLGCHCHHTNFDKLCWESLTFGIITSMFSSPVKKSPVHSNRFFFSWSFCWNAFLKKSQTWDLPAVDDHMKIF